MVAQILALIMVHQLFTTCKSSGVFSIILLLTNPLAASAKEYVFTAPSEANRQIVEIPSRETEYPLYECQATTTEEVDQALESHDCICTDCAENPKELEVTESNSELNLNTKTEHP